MQGNRVNQMSNSRRLFLCNQHHEYPGNALMRTISTTVNNGVPCYQVDGSHLSNTAGYFLVLGITTAGPPYMTKKAITRP